MKQIKAVLFYILEKEKCHSSVFVSVCSNAIYFSDRLTVMVFIFQVTEYLYANKMAFRYPEPEDKAKYVKERIWRSDYVSLLPDVYDWPESSLKPPQVSE